MLAWRRTYSERDHGEAAPVAVGSKEGENLRGQQGAPHAMAEVLVVGPE